jgi:aminoglycoside phosphotransferase (APT) family kinase protein
LTAALRALAPGSSIAAAPMEVLTDHPGRRRVVRVDDVVVKAFSSSEHAAWEREVAGLRAAGPEVAVELVAHGERWTATRFVSGTEVPMRLEVGEVAIHQALGPWLARLHDRPPWGLRAWSVVDRLRERVASPPAGCPDALAADVGRLVEPLLRLAREDTLVHGDWGTANVLVPADDPAHVLRIIDFEDAHRGDPAEDFAWQVLAGPGPDGVQLPAMAATYAPVRSLGRHPVERLVVAGAEKCLDVLGWSLSGEPGARFSDRCRRTLEELVAGTWPAWPTT